MAYESNRAPLPPGTLTQTFPDIIQAMRDHSDPAENAVITSDNVLQWARLENRERIATMSRRLLLPGSGLFGIEYLHRAAEHAALGEACVICSSHRSNLDVPTVYALMADFGEAELFDRIVWIAGRKLNEDSPDSKMCVENFNRLVVTPRSYFHSERDEEELVEARRVNIQAQRELHRIRRDGHLVWLFPTGTRIRDHLPQTAEAISETYSYLKGFDHIVLCNIAGCTLPVTNDADLINETPQLDVVSVTFAPALSFDKVEAAALSAYPDADRKEAVRRWIMPEILSLRPT